MRLVIKITIFYLFVTTIVFIIGGVIAFQVMNREIQFEQSIYLGERMPSLVNYLERRQPTDSVIRDKLIIVPLKDTLPEMGPVYSDTLVMHTTLQRIEPHIKLEAIRNVNNRSYRIIIYDLVIEPDDIRDIVEESLTMIFALLLFLIVGLGLLGSYFVFRPFGKTLSAIKNFSIQQLKPIRLPDSSTSEFIRLNKFIKDMTDKATKDYVSLKEFSENASHEMQTPLAIAQGKLEILMGDEKLTEQQLELITSAQNAIKRVSRLGNSLSLITKIDNKEFSDTQEIDFSKELNRFIYDFKELMDLKSLSVKTKIQDNQLIHGNLVLIELLLTNLLNNAIRHNQEKGYIDIKLENKKLTIENSGFPLKNKPEEYFERFRKGTNDPGSSGLGLSIIKKICDDMGVSITYENEDTKHIIKLSWI
ncbi:MAG: HAMP domain-containing histidine kinase [Cyclobacteriaceae bacterium]|nr:HAMP domain-containing histidine kinase [Cyclobacteriaceae bacterium SS2]